MVPVTPITIDRLSKLGPQDWIAVYCGDWRCSKHSAGTDLDIPATIARYGDLPLLNMGRFFRCSLCGHRPARIRHGWRLPQSQAKGWITPGEGSPEAR